MKLSISLAAASALFGVATGKNGDSSSIYELACSTPDLSTLCGFIDDAGFKDALSGGEWTVFAPTNDAFDKLGLDSAPSTEDLQNLLLFHAVADMVVLSSDLVCRELVHMANMEDSRTVCKGPQKNPSLAQKGPANKDSALPMIIGADIMASNGVVHLVDNVLLPKMFLSQHPPDEVDDDELQPPVGKSSIYELACSTPDLSTLCGFIDDAGFEDALSGGEWTVFAPTNDAFDKLGLDSAPSTEDLQNLLLFHAVADMVVLSSDLVCRELVSMANMEDSRTVCSGKQKNLSLAQKGVANTDSNLPMIIGADIMASNGVVHLVDNVLLPKMFLASSVKDAMDDDALH